MLYMGNQTACAFVTVAKFEEMKTGWFNLRQTWQNLLMNGKVKVNLSLGLIN
jgi:hypothetical protein